jgi:hypothetical protein
MDFSNRNVQSQDVAPGASGNPGANLTKNRGNNNRRGDKGKWARAGIVVLAVAVAALIIGIICITVGGNQKSEDSYVDTGKLQAVFLNTGQVYFGNIKSLNDKYYVLTNIYYLQTASSSSSSSSNANNNVSLVKLGCELHQPYDQMVINTSQVTFWENLQSDGQVAKAVATFQKDNPNGQKCADQSSSSSSNSSSSVQSAGSSNSSGTGSSSSNP